MVFAREEEILRDRMVWLPDVYEANWQEHALHLMRYVAKHAGCRITDLGREHSGLPSLDGLRGFLEGGAFPADLEVEVGVDLGWRALHRLASLEPNPETGRTDGVAHLGQVWGIHRISTGELSGPQSSFGTRWLIFHWRVGGGQGHANPVVSPNLKLTNSDAFGRRGRWMLTRARWRQELATRLGRAV